jgi:CheY-like chemotaxis protein
VLDVRLPGLSGLELQKRIAGANREIPIVFITGHGDVPTSVRAMAALPNFQTSSPDAIGYHVEDQTIGRTAPGASLFADDQAAGIRPEGIG